MIKKIFQSFTFFAFIQVLIFSCCNDEYNVYYETLEIIANDISDEDATSVSSENLVLHFNPIYEYVFSFKFQRIK